jgi:hypothetical protein
MKCSKILRQGPNEFRNFDAFVGGLMSIPSAEMARREAAYKVKPRLTLASAAWAA